MLPEEVLNAVREFCLGKRLDFPDVELDRLYKDDPEFRDKYDRDPVIQEALKNWSHFINRRKPET